jgi:hypothetical protein
VTLAPGGTRLNSAPTMPAGELNGTGLLLAICV